MKAPASPSVGRRFALAAAGTAVLVAAGCAPGTGGPSGAGTGAGVDSLAAAVRSSITREGLEEQARAITGHTRLSGSPGENAAIDHIVGTLRADGVPVEVHEFDVYASDPVSASVEVVGGGFAPDAITVAFSGSVDGLTAPLVDVGSRRNLPDVEAVGERIALRDGSSMPGGLDPADLEGAIVLLDGTPWGVPVHVLERLGAAGAVFVNPEERLNDLTVTTTWGNPSLRNHHRLPSLPVAEVRRSDGERLRELLAEGALRIRLSTEARTGWKPVRLALARIPGPEPDAPYVLFGSHIDAWGHGGTDAGSSNAAGVELARAFWQHRDMLRRGLVVAWWPAHSNARYAGSQWFVDHFYEELRARGLAYLNMDGVGQTGATEPQLRATSSLAPLGKALFRELGDSVEADRPGLNSDQVFNGVALPLLQLRYVREEPDGGLYWWWHTPEDTFDKIDFEILERDMGLYVDALSSLLAEPVYPVDAAGQVRGLAELIRARQETAGDAFALEEALARTEALVERVEEMESAIPADGRPGLDVELVRLLRPLHRVVYAALGPYHPYMGTGWEPLPGLRFVDVLAAEEPASDRYRFARTTLIRERNRLLEALDEAGAEARRLLEELEGGP